MIYTRGSEWNRWDFHIHTPETLKNDQFLGRSPEEKWEKYYKDIKEYIGDGKDPQHRIIAMGVTDYLSIENYKKILSDNVLNPIIPFIFPNVELRLTQGAVKAPINIHCLFNPEICDQLDDLFFSKLTFNFKGNPYQATKSSLIRLGKAIDSTFNDKQAYLEANEKFLVSFEQLKQILDQSELLRKNTLIAIASKSKDGVSGLSTDTQFKLLHDELCAFADFIFSANPNDILYYLGEKEGGESKKQIIHRYGKLKPCIHGSDAHTNTKIFEPDKKRYCWIKATPSFEGMKEIIYEPKDRVKIQELKPELKKGYYVIDKVYIDDEGFSPEPILFNERLNCIIGGKSTGKSILLNNLAETISPQQVRDKYKIIDPNRDVPRYYQIKDMKVIWGDDAISKKGIEQTDRKIVFIPQTYLNKLSDESEEKTEIDVIIQDIILQNDEIKQLYDIQTQEISDTKKLIDKSIYDLLGVKEKIDENQQKILEKGEAKSVEAEIKKLKDKKDKLVSETDLSEEEISAFDKNVKLLNAKKEELKVLNKDLIIIDAVKDVVEKNDVPLNISDVNRSILIQKQQIIYENSIAFWEKEKAKILNGIKIKTEEINKEIVELEKAIIKLQPKIDGNASIKQLSEEIAQEEKKLDQIKQIESEIEKLRKTLGEKLDFISELVGKFYFSHNKFAEKVNQQALFQAQDLEFRVDVPFRTEMFFKEFCLLVNNKKLSQFFRKNKDNEYEFLAEDYDSTFVKSKIEVLLNSNDLGLLKKNSSIETVLRCLTSDWYNVTYNVTLDNDDLSKMSPGKKALVLLKLLINLAESQCPILIDQPEDDLDNRSVYNELVNFIREKKVYRQIILVTHNANIVVGCDSDEVIVANQEGKNSPNLKYKLEYKSGAIEDTLPNYDEQGNKIKGTLYKTGIQQHICEVLEGGEEAFNVRRKKYSINQ